MPKKAYRVRNWKEYNQGLVQRGSLTLWISEELLQSWYANRTGQRGRPLHYSQQVIACGLNLKAVFGLTYRSMTGLLESLFKLLRLRVEIPHYSLFCKRQAEVAFAGSHRVKQRHAGEGLHLLVDSTGLRLVGEGEWRQLRQGNRYYRTWRKLHLAMNAKTHQVEAFTLTDLGVQDCQAVPSLLASISKPIASLKADGAYDRFTCYDQARQRHFRLLTPPQHNARLSQERPRNKKKAHPEAVQTRDQVIRRVREIGRTAWKIETGYHQRSLVETTMFRIKQLLGGRLTARTFATQQIEVGIWLNILNTFTTLGRPLSEVIN